MITEFYAVTAYLTDPDKRGVSLYRIVQDEGDRVTVQKIGLKGESSIKVSDYIENGFCLGIMIKGGLQRYDKTGSRRVDEVNIVYWGGGTSPIIGLFENQEDATTCFESDDLKHWDERFVGPSEKVLLEIGPDSNQTISLDMKLAAGVRAGKLRECLRS